LLILLLAGVSAEAQVVFPGSTPQGDYLRGVGIAAWGMGLYNLNTAQAEQINAQTFMMLNEYIWTAYKNEMKENAEYRRAMREKNAENYRKYHERIHDHPDAIDAMNGAALNAVLGDLLAPSVSDSASRYAQIPLDADVIRRIPFKLGEKGEKFSMGRLSLKGTRKWAVVFQDPVFTPFREAYQRAVDNALELALDGRMTDKAIEDIEKAFDDLEEKFKRTPVLLDPKRQREYSEGKTQLDKMRDAPRLFMTQQLQPVFREIETYAGTTVDDLRVFMRRHNLTFAPAETHDERELYPQLYTALVEQRKKATGTE
jgi:hypothetical protein